MAKTVVCPCHDVTVDDLTRLARQGFDHSETLKRVTGALTGPCQGRYCASTVLRILRDLGAASGEEAAPRRPTVRPPLTPVLLGHLARLDESHGSTEGER